LRVVKGVREFRDLSSSHIENFIIGFRVDMLGSCMFFFIMIHSVKCVVEMTFPFTLGIRFRRFNKRTYYSSVRSSVPDIICGSSFGEETKVIFGLFRLDTKDDDERKRDFYYV